MTSHIVNTLTDRAVVNQAAVKVIMEAWDKKINILYCHLHPLDTIASAVKKCLVELEGGADRSLPAHGCLSHQIMAHFNTLRFTDNLGDPRGFRIHLLKNHLPKGLLKNGRGNRLHLFFNQAEVYAEHQAVLLDYVRSNCTKNLQNLVKLMRDYESPLAMAEFQAVGIMSRLLSAPWMSRFYRDVERSFSYIQVFQQVKAVIGHLAAMAADTSLDVASINCDFFGDAIEKSKASNMWAVDVDSRVPECLRAMAKAIHNVLVRQYKDKELDDLDHVTCK